MSDICELEDFNRDCCVNCFNGFPNYGCPKQEEENRRLRELVHKKAQDKEKKIRADERAKILENLKECSVINNDCQYGKDIKVIIITAEKFSEVFG